MGNDDTIDIGSTGIAPICIHRLQFATLGFTALSRSSPLGSDRPEVGLIAFGLDCLSCLGSPDDAALNFFTSNFKHRNCPFKFFSLEFLGSEFDH